MPNQAMVTVISLSSFSFLFIIIPSIFALDFNFSQISTAPNGTIRMEGDAYMSPEGIQITPGPEKGDIMMLNRVGRATYFNSLHLWDRSSRNITDFSTHFTFVIDSRNKSKDFADGLTFFLAPTNSSIPNSAEGEGLGLAGGNVTQNKTSEPFVAVEFDPFPNGWDPNTSHVGIDVNSLRSVATEIWVNNFTLGPVNDAWISYNATSQNLSVVFTGFSRNGTHQASLSYVLDLRDYLPENVTFGFSAATGIFFQTNTIKSWKFSSSLDLGFVNHDPVKPGEGKSNIGLKIGLSVGSAVLILVLAIFSYILWKKSNQKKEGSIEHFMDNEFEKGSGPKKFSYQQLARATNNFSEAQKLGEGGFGGVYKGFLRDENIYIAVKKVCKGSKQGLKEYASEVNIISKLRHRNLVQLLGWCHGRTGELLLVYEFMPNGSLDSHLFKGNSILDWETRYKIAKGLASALLYLHEEWEQCVVHRDIKSSNVMLDSNFNTKLGDFGLARLVDHEKGFQTTILAGTIGYMAPECVITLRASKETDVYSFGIVALEIACGKRPTIVIAKDDCIRTVEWVWELYGRGMLFEAADPKLSTDFDRQEMERLMIVGLWCAHPDSSLRPTIRQVIQVLNFEAELPVLPPRIPVLTCLSSPPRTFNTDSLNFTSSSVDSAHSASHFITR